VLLSEATTSGQDTFGKSESTKFGNIVEYRVSSNPWIAMGNVVFSQGNFGMSFLAQYPDPCLRVDKTGPCLGAEKTEHHFTYNLYLILRSITKVIAGKRLIRARNI